jgi:hypothetical protein
MTRARPMRVLAVLLSGLLLTAGALVAQAELAGGATGDLHQMCREALKRAPGRYAEFCFHEGLETSGNAHASGIPPVPGMPNSEESKLCEKHPVQCVLYYDDGLKAIKLTESLFSGNPGDSDSTMANAFQHGYWVVLMANSSAPDHALAMRFAKAHEYDNKTGDYKFNSPTSKVRFPSRLDMLNNTSAWTYAARQTYGNIEEGDEDLCRAIVQKVKNGSPIDPKVDPFAEYERRGWNADRAMVIWQKTATTHGEPVRLVNEDCEPA